MNKPMIADRQPDAGKPTVRDEGGLAETCTTTWAKWAPNAATPKQLSLGLVLDCISTRRPADGLGGGAP